jgi:hypothetical protein
MHSCCRICFIEWCGFCFIYFFWIQNLFKNDFGKQIHLRKEKKRKTDKLTSITGGLEACQAGLLFFPRCWADEIRSLHCPALFPRPRGPAQEAAAAALPPSFASLTQGPTVSHVFYFES